MPRRVGVGGWKYRVQPSQDQYDNFAKLTSGIIGLLFSPAKGLVSSRTRAD